MGFTAARSLISRRLVVVCNPGGCLVVAVEGGSVEVVAVLVDA